MDSYDPMSFLTEERIRSRAEEFYVERGSADGRALEDWLRAEKDLTDSYLEGCFQKLAKKSSA